jgi:tripartite-type tricarboxylate transporter receptor subunit TctC
MSRENATMPVLHGILAAVLLLTGVAPALAQGYPNRPVRTVVGCAAGGPTDVIARLVAQNFLKVSASSSLSRMSTQYAYS